ncbi:Fibropellin-1 [Holothuria leucospilota]|uniref:Fibropellin-1 n=1 Tax=Holothuria leucospilota TaxID=206669 RepID=A0A9Q1BK48_HOLLE|nr:Fibropellin-1 [Holothuria leucospilota]
MYGTDPTGNTAAICKFNFSVKTRYCQQLLPPTHGRFVGPCLNHYGSMCNVQCIEGYRLNGSSQASCEWDEAANVTFWDRETLPKCTISRCPPIPANIVPTSGGISPAHCTGKTKPVYGTVCTFYCNNRFTLSGYTVPIICQADGTWSYNLTANSAYCMDEVDPTIIVCPKNQILTLSECNNEVEAYFDVPFATDNSRDIPVIEKNPADVQSPYTLNETTIVTYEFFDQSNNSAKCTFQIIVQRKILPEVIHCPDNIKVPATGRLTPVFWQQPTFSHPYGKNDSLSVRCNFDSGREMRWGKYDIICAATNLDNGKTVECKFRVDVIPKSCHPLPLPRYGNLSCNSWTTGKFCKQQCDEKFDVPPGNYNPLFICGSSGLWERSKILDCSLKKRPRFFYISSKIQYYGELCSDTETRKAIQNAFSTLISDHISTAAVCEVRQKCRAENVLVTCGGARNELFLPSNHHRTDRKTKDLNLKDHFKNQGEELIKRSKKANYVLKRHEELMIRRAKRNVNRLNEQISDNQKGITISFQIIANTPDDILYEDYDDTAYNIIDTLYSLVDVLEQEAQNGILVSPIDNVSLTINQDQAFFYDFVRPNCVEGFVVSSDSLTCVPCVAGTYFNTDTAQCTMCPIGTYQDSDKQTQCLQCPPGTTTLEEGASHSVECPFLCSAGKYSLNGVEPCTLCELGFYQPRAGARRCIPCPSHYVPIMMGSKSREQCRAPCYPGFYSSTGFEPCRPCPIPSSNSTVCNGIASTFGDGTENKTQCNGSKECGSNHCLNGASCVLLRQGPICICADGFNGTNCEHNIDDCTEYSCYNGGTCIDSINSYNCICLPGFTGPDCSSDIDECTSEPCINASVCIDLKGDFMCECSEGYTGKRCEDEMNPCDSSPCQNKGICQYTPTSFQCICPSGTTGELCEDEIDECQSLPCLNNGICSDLRDSYECVCAPGYSGNNCEIDEDLCEPNPCLSGGTCVERADMYICVCPSDKAGDFCERDLTPCDKKPCVRGKCVPSPQTVDGNKFNYTCDCSLTGFMGINCQFEVEECLSNPCSNGGICKDRVNGYICECPTQFTGETCEQTVNLCDKAVCKNNGTCIVNGSFASCICPIEFEGANCETARTNCQDGFCQNGGHCAPSGSNEMCICLEGFNGLACEKNINTCIPDPCENSGVCVGSKGGYVCECQDGFTGGNCEIETDECSSEPCANGACFDQINDFICHCFDGYEGKLCDVNTDDCAEHMCIEGKCKDGNQTYTCECNSGFRGRYCEIEMDECLSNPCVHSVGCTDRLDNYECICQNGWTGRNCETSIDDCEYHICGNGGTCYDAHVGFTCLCLPGFEGEFCEKNVNECASSPCLEGKCIDEVNGYKCTCPHGRLGKQCQIHTNPCLSNPCSNGGTCLQDKEEEGYSCICVDGFVGDICETNENDCANNDCPENATCVDEVNGYSCICPSGFEGEDCDEVMDPCLSLLCENGGSCFVADDSKSSCRCPLGYEGIFCERNVDDCLPNPCLNDGVCVDGINEFTCQCATGFSGNVCDERVNFCLNNLCDHFGTKQCHDEIDGYTCECRHGFLGQYCDKVSNMNYDMVFSEYDANQFVVLREVPLEEIQSFTLVLWLRTASNESFTLKQGIESGNQRVSESLIMKFPHRLTVTIHGQSLKTGVSVNDDSWHHIALTFDHNTYLIHIFVDGRVVIRQIVPVTSNVISTNGAFILGSSEDPVDNKHFSGRISGINLWDKVMTPNTIMEYSKECTTRVSGNIIGMEDFLGGLLGDIWIEEPSKCDVTNDCENSPCLNGGTCIDEYNKFVCLCPNGLSGATCEVNLDDCLVHVCENNGTCVDGLDTFTCECRKGFTGTFCELESVDGGWSDWSSWTLCSTSCDGGTQSRTRECNNPEPRNGGTSCGKEDKEARDCNVQPCPVCTKFGRPKHGYSRCKKEPSGDTSCTIHCYLGYSFSTPPIIEYSCGNSTRFIWTHASKAYPRMELPSCTKLRKPRGYEVHLKTTYKNLRCFSMGEPYVREAKDHIKQTAIVVSQREGCIRTNECQLIEIRTSGCDPKISKRDITMREEGSTSNVTVSVTYFQSVNIPEEDYASNDDIMAQMNAEKAILNLRNLTMNLANRVQDGSYLISAGGNLYDAVYEDTIESISCADGDVPHKSQVMCLPCAAGTFKSQNDCVPCGEGFFQPEQGQTSCLPCPEGTVSPVLGAVSVEECEPESASDPRNDL